MTGQRRAKWRTEAAQMVAMEVAFHVVALWAICLTATRYDCQDRWTATLCGVACGLNVIALGVKVWAVWHG